MLKRIFQLSILAFIAWLLSPVLNIILPLPTESMVEVMLNLDNKGDAATFKVLRYVVWIIALALISKFIKPFLSFVLPISRRYGTTKILRRLQGKLVYFIAFLFFGFITCVGYVALFGSVEFDTISESEFDSFGDSLITEFVTEREDLKDLMTFHRKEAEKIALEYLDKKELTEYDVWPHDNKKHITDHPKKLLNKFSDGTNTVYWVLKSRKLYFDERYSKLYRDQWILQDKLNKKIKEYEDYAEAYLSNGRGEEFAQEIAEQRTWARFDDSYFQFWLYVLKDFWITSSAIAAILTLVFFFANKYHLAKFYERFIHFFQQGQFGLGGSARFAGLLEEWGLDFGFQKHGLFMGRSLYNHDLAIGLEDPRHMLTIAGTRAGKGATAIIPNLIFWEGSALVIDPKGTNATVTMKRRKNALKQNVHIIDPFHIVDIPNDERACFNPLEFLDVNSPSIREQINIIVEALVVPDQNQKEKHWDDGAKTIIAGLIAHLITSDKFENPTLYHLRDLISCMPEEQDVLWAEMSMNEKAGRLAKDAANRVIRGINTNEISSIISNADKHTEWLSSPAMVNTLGYSSFQFGEMKDCPTTIYLVLPPEYLETHNRFLRLFVNLVINQMSIGGRAKVPVMLMLDEFLALGRMEEVEKAFGLMAGYNLVLWPFVQDLGRLKELYGKSVNAFIANSRAIQVFGINDEETKDYVSKAIGNRKLDKSILGTNNQMNAYAKLRDETEVGLDIAADGGRQYILRAGKAPLIIEKTPYYNDVMFSGKYTPDPDYKKG